MASQRLRRYRAQAKAARKAQEQANVRRLIDERNQPGVLADLTNWLLGTTATPALAGTAGMLATAVPGVEAGSVTKELLQSHAYRPRTPFVHNLEQGLAELLQPVVDWNRETMGGGGYERFGPLGGAAGETLLPALMTLAPGVGPRMLRGAPSGSPTAQRGGPLISPRSAPRAEAVGTAAGGGTAAQTVPSGPFGGLLVPETAARPGIPIPGQSAGLVRPDAPQLVDPRGLPIASGDNAGLVLPPGARAPEPALAPRAGIGPMRRQIGAVGDISRLAYEPRLGALGAGGDPQVRSGRVPWVRQGSKRAMQGDDPALEGAIDWRQWQRTPGAAEAAERIRGNPFIPTGRARSITGVLDRAAEHLAQNTSFLYGMEDPVTAARALNWYPGANRVAQSISDAYGLPIENTAFGIAALSPQKEWNLNVDSAIRNQYINATQQGTRMTDEMLNATRPDGALREVFHGVDKKGKLKASSKKARERLERIRGKTLGELTDPSDQAMWAIMFDRAYMPAETPIRNVLGDPTGQTMTYVPNTLGQIANAFKAFNAPDFDTAAAALGGKPKVRSFGANIVDPFDPRFVTVDTHQVAGSALMPWGGEAPAVKQAFGGGLTQESAAAANKGKGVPWAPWMDTITEAGSLGYSGTQPLYQQAVNLAAAEAGVIPRGMQSVTWDLGRRWMENKKTDPNKAAAGDIWQAYGRGQLTLEEAQNAVWDIFLRRTGKAKK